MKELVQAVKQWGVNKGLHKVGHLAQAEYTLKEVAELLDAYADKDINSIKDAIGDILVTIIVGSSNLEADYLEVKEYLVSGSFREYPKRTNFEDNFQLLLGYGFSLKLDSEDKNTERFSAHYCELIKHLNFLVSIVGRDFNENFSLMHCLQLAYNEIKDRKGHTDENGHFIKEN